MNQLMLDLHENQHMLGKEYDCLYGELLRINSRAYKFRKEKSSTEAGSSMQKTETHVKARGWLHSRICFFLYVWAIFILMWVLFKCI